MGAKPDIINNVSFHHWVPKPSMILVGILMTISHLVIAQNLDAPAFRKNPGSYTADALVEVNSPPAPLNDSLIAIVGVKLIDGLGGPPLDDAVVIIDGNRIAEVGVRGDLLIPDHAILYDATGKTLLPGLIDAHLHSVNDDAFLNV